MCLANFIDGTVAGNPADLTIYNDANIAKDHTYYGNGCPGSAGSITPCSSRIAKTADNEDQKNGTYYHYQAASSGAGGSMATANTNTPDSFCPLGWQMPYGGTDGDYYNKSKSWRYLLFTKYGLADNAEGSVAARSYPLSNAYTGYTMFFDFKLTNLGNATIHWTATLSSVNNSFRTGFFNTSVQIENVNNKAMAFTVRCFHRRHGGRD